MMKQNRTPLYICLLLLFVLPTSLSAKISHPSVFLTAKGAKEIRTSKGVNSDFDRLLNEVIAAADEAVARGVLLPEPLDGGGGYSHEKHKQNYYDLYNSGIAYQVSGDERYAEFVGRMLSEYATLYPTLGYHPLELSKTPGRLFWQTLNECVWLIHTSIAYDCVYDYLPKQQKERIENNLLRPMVDFIIYGTQDNDENNRTFNKMHNHGTWATAAVGMAGFVLDDSEYVKKALYGSDMSGKNGGFLMQLNHLFSPDGYFTEGAYYHRYAIWPFVLFAQAIENNMPEVGIFEYRDGILEKAVDALIQVAYDGEFMKINDAMDKGYDAQELVYAIDIIYNYRPTNKQFLDIADRYQKTFLPTDAGFRVAKDIAASESEPYHFKSVLLSDGADGTNGGLAIMRSFDELGQESAVVVKATSHGLSHGHYDKLNLLYFDNGCEIIPDYGAARFVNIEAKYKGHYTPLNKSFAMTTIAHNTVVVNEKSHYGGKINVSSKHNPEIAFADFTKDGIRVVSAVDSTAYDNCRMQRTVAYAEIPCLEHPLIIDLFDIESDTQNQYDYPLYYNGHMISATFPYAKATSVMKTLGEANGYQHLWVEAKGNSKKNGIDCFTWLENNRFYSANTLVTKDADYYLTRTGANDPAYYLRSQAGLLVRENAKNHTFVTTIESHGSYDPSTELTTNVTSSVKDIVMLKDSKEHKIIKIEFKDGNNVHFCLSQTNSSKMAEHRVETDSGAFEWTGPFALIYGIE